MYTKISDKTLNKIYISSIIAIIIIRLIMVSSIPIWIRDDGGADEYLMLKEAETLLKDQYLGEYDELTLVKGIMFPLFLSVIAQIGIPYMTAVTLLNTLSCVVALYTMSKFVRNRFVKTCFFGFMMFLPSTYSTNTTLVYRDSITAALAILVICCLMLMYLYLYKNRRKCVLASLCAGFSWLILWHTREDTIWTIPLAGIVFIISEIYIFRYSKQERKEKIFYAGVILLPVVLVFLSIQTISYFNYKNYDIWTTNELNDSNYTEAVMLMMTIKPENDVEYVEITRETLQRLYDISPSLENLKEIIEYDYDNRGPMFTAGYNPDNGELNGDLITWELRGAAARMGYYETAQMAEQYWKSVTDEIQAAIDDGRLETRKIMPSRSMIAWPGKQDSFSRFLKSIGELYYKTISFDCCNVVVPVTTSTISEECRERYENITGNSSVDNSSYEITLSGWAFSKDGESTCMVTIEDADEKVYCQLNLLPSEDLYTGFLSNLGIIYENSHNARFYVNSTFETNQLFLIVRDQNQKIVGKINLADINDQIWNTEEYEYAIDELQIKEHKAVKYQLAEARTQKLNKVKTVYCILNMSFALIADLYYIGWTLGIIVQVLKKRKIEWNQWLFCSAILGSSLIVLGGLGYVNAFMVDTSGYLSTAYGLVTLFNISVVSLITDRIIHYKRKNQVE